MDEVLTDRKKKILKAIIKTYMETGEPVGSRTISKDGDLNVSSATIRNEMSDLTDLGYIVQPHTSAGRIPSDKGYRLYVDELMREKEDEIEEIRNQVPDMEIEIFVHGALCMAYSGRCLLSGYINKRDPNQGTCTNACRWEYNVQEGKEDDVGNIVHKYEPIQVQNVEPTLGIGAPTDKVFMIEEAQRPGEYMTAFEDEHGTYIMNSKDLRAIAHVERLTKMGVHSLKIEGRTKSFYYCARTAQVYRKAIDDAAAGKPFDTSLLETLEGLAHRGYTEGFLRRHTHDDYQNYEYGYSVSDRQQFVGEFTGERKGDLAAVAVKNKFSVGDSLELMTPQGNINFTLEHMENAKGEAMPVAPGDGYTVWLPVPQDLELNYALLMRNFSGETTRNPHGK